LNRKPTPHSMINGIACLGTFALSRAFEGAIPVAGPVARGT
jgi:hypothetical protein